MMNGVAMPPNRNTVTNLTMIVENVTETNMDAHVSSVEWKNTPMVGNCLYIISTIQNLRAAMVKKWKLVPLCNSCHGKAHNQLWQARIEYLLKYI